MSLFRCCVGAPPRIASDNAGGGRPGTVAAARAKAHKPAEVFFDIPKPEGQLSSVTDPATSGRDYADQKKRKESREKVALRGVEQVRNLPPPRKPVPQNELDMPDNNGLSRGQNFMKVEKWLRESRKHEQVGIAPDAISNIEDHPPGSSARDNDDYPTPPYNTALRR